MSAIEIAATRQVPADGGVLEPLDTFRSVSPTSCATTVEGAELTAQLARMAGLHQAAAHWAERAVDLVRGFGGNAVVDTGVACAPSGSVSVTELIAARSAHC
ncbi:hypothetical protein ABJI51_05135 [Amycolatopsis sp. NEAU-NG30]|uniref:Uncharacterized protein n=1 Tax=Amycolatopsis melonis TaxID=3156488 RepID=A0ABV0LAC9_9PSEU